MSTSDGWQRASPFLISAGVAIAGSLLSISVMRRVTADVKSNGASLAPPRPDPSHVAGQSGDVRAGAAGVTFPPPQHGTADTTQRLRDLADRRLARAFDFYGDAMQLVGLLIPPALALAADFDGGDGRVQLLYVMSLITSLALALAFAFRQHPTEYGATWHRPLNLTPAMLIAVVLNLVGAGVTVFLRPA